MRDPNPDNPDIAPAAPAGTPNVLEKILGAAPFGLEIASAGRKVYSNLAASPGRAVNEGDRPGEDGTIRTRQFSFACEGETYELSLSLDEAERLGFEQDLIQRAWFDELTGLPNRGLIERSVSALIESEGSPFGLVFIDINGFKHINEYYGHPAGDLVLKRLAERLAAGLRNSDLLARLSGDEFVLLVSPIAGVEALARDVDRISARIEEPLVIDGHEVFVSASIGISLFPQHGGTYDELLSNADRAMYCSKSRRKGSVTLFDGTIEHAVAERGRLEQRLRLAIRDKHVCCAYQPKVDLRSGEVSGVEVLMRWKDEGGFIQPPGELLKLAVGLGLTDDLTHLVIAETVQFIDRINEAFGRDCSISINIAAPQAADSEFMRSLIDRLDATGFARRFILELTEEAFLPAGVFQTMVLPMIRSLGARVSIDDFGTGYSSLSALADITADEIKVDRSFISEIHRRPRSQTILRAIEAIGHSLGMTIVAEGIETFEELAYLQATTRIGLGQGFYFSKPLLLEELHEASNGSPLRPSTPSRERTDNRITEQRPRAF